MKATRTSEPRPLRLNPTPGALETTLLGLGVRQEREVETVKVSRGVEVFWFRGISISICNHELQVQSRIIRREVCPRSVLVGASSLDTGRRRGNEIMRHLPKADPNQPSGGDGVRQGVGEHTTMWEGM